MFKNKFDLSINKLEKQEYTHDKRFFKNQIVEDEKLLTKKEIAEFLSVSIKMIDKKVHMNEIPFMKIGRLVRFSKSKILAWAEESNSSR
jgi:excisionase family DNA binding protein